MQVDTADVGKFKNLLLIRSNRLIDGQRGKVQK